MISRPRHSIGSLTAVLANTAVGTVIGILGISAPRVGALATLVVWAVHRSPLPGPGKA